MILMKTLLTKEKEETQMKVTQGMDIVDMEIVVGPIITVLLLYN